MIQFSMPKPIRKATTGPETKADFGRILEFL